MRRVPSFVLTTLATGLFAALLQAQSPAPAPPTSVTFAKDIQPIMERSCWTCHGESMQLSKLDLRTREAALKGGATGPAIVPGDAEHSRLYRMVAGLEAISMPMEGDALKPAEVAAIKAWIDQGAQWEAPVSFATDIQPIMERTCWNCHGASMQSSKLDLRTRESALRGGAHGAAFVPGNAEGSRLYRLVAGLDDIRMALEGTKLTDAEIAAVKTWIKQGGQYPAASAAAPATAAASTPAASSSLSALEIFTPTAEQRNYWAFKLPVQAPVPNEGTADKYDNPIDRFLEAARAKKGLVPAPRADRRTLIRRAYLDLTGLPPSPAEVEAFIADQSENAWEKVVNTLLASPRYGERWGRHWLDVARYADSNGFEQDYNRPNAWRYRDYV